MGGEGSFSQNKSADTQHTSNQFGVRRTVFAVSFEKELSHSNLILPRRYEPLGAKSPVTAPCSAYSLSYGTT